MRFLLFLRRVKISPLPSLREKPLDAADAALPPEEDVVGVLPPGDDGEEVVVQVRCEAGVDGHGGDLGLLMAVLHQLYGKARRAGGLQETQGRSASGRCASKPGPGPGPGTYTFKSVYALIMKQDASIFVVNQIDELPRSPRSFVGVELQKLVVRVVGRDRLKLQGIIFQDEQAAAASVYPGR